MILKHKTIECRTSEFDNRFKNWLTEENKELEIKGYYINSLEISHNDNWIHPYISSHYILYKLDYINLIGL